MKFALTLTCAFAVFVGAGTSRAEQGFTDSEKKVFQKNLHVSKSVVNWWNHKGRWALFSRHEKCWEVIGSKQRAVCRHARHSLKSHAARIERLTALLAPPPVYGPMSSICGSSCISCESGWNPNAWNGDDYWGLYQFDYGTWKAHGGVPSMWGKASASEQHRVAANIRYDAWPNC